LFSERAIVIALYFVSRQSTKIRSYRA